MAANDIAARVRATAQELGVDPDFAARIAGAESSFNEAAVSPKGARGVMQVMPATAKDLATRYGDDNIRQGVGYLRELGQMFEPVPEAQRSHFIAAAYNAGPDRVMKLMEKAKAAGKDPYNIASLADHLPEETLNYVANLGEAASAPRQLQAPEGSTTTATATPPKRQASLGRALYRSLANEGERQISAVNELGNAASAVPQSAGDVAHLVLSALNAAGPALSPAMTAGSVAGETASRMGAIPLEPEQGAQAGALATGAAQLAPGLIRGGARLLSPALRAGERNLALRGAAEARQASAGAARETQLAARAPAGTEAQGVVQDIGNRLQGGADTAFQRMEASSPTALRLQPKAATPERTVTSPLVDEFGRPVQTTVPGTPAKTLTEADYSAQFKNLRRDQTTAGQAAIDFDRRVSQRLAKQGPHATTRTLAQDPDVLDALMLHATPAEGAILQRAVAAGRPLTKLPYTPEELASIGRDIVNGQSFLTPLLHYGMAGAGMGYFSGVKGAREATLALVAGRLGLKALDVMLGSRPGVAAIRGLGRLAPGSPEVVRLLGAAAGELHGQRLTPKQ